MPAPIKAIVDRFEENLAVLKTDNQEYLWPRANLPEGAKEGSVLYLEARLNQEESVEREKLAKKILNEILTKKHEPEQN